MAPHPDPRDSKPVNPEMITLARESRGLTQSELAAKLNTTQSHVSKLEAGTLQAEEYVASLARVLDYPPSFFRLTDRVYGPSTSEFFHRKRTAVAVKVLAKIHALLNLRRMHVSRLMKAADLPVTVPRFDPDEFHGDIEEIARAVRAVWQLPRGPVRNVVSTIENAGGIVIRMRFDTNKVDAVSWWTPGDPPIFVVNETMPADRERITLCHELGHLVMHATIRPEMEDEANRFAAAFLMPADDIRSQLADVSLHSLAALKPHWKVSMQAILHRAQDLRLIPEGRARYLWSQISRAGYRTREPAELDFAKEETGLLRELVELHTDDLGYDVRQLGGMLALNEHEVVASYPIKGAARAPLRRVK